MTSEMGERTFRMGCGKEQRHGRGTGCVCGGSSIER